MLSRETLYALFELQQRTLCAFLRTAHQGKEYRKISVSLRLLANCFVNCPVKLREPLSLVWS